MSSTSQALKRLGVGSVSVATVLAMPYVGVGSAFAITAAPTPGPTATLAIASQTTSTGSIRNDGSNASVKISAVATVPSTSGNPAVASVRFSYAPITGAVTGAPVVIATDNTAPFSVEWTPVAGSYSEIAEGLDGSGTLISSATATLSPITVGDFSSAHISSPAEGASIGRSAGGSIIVSGTRSADLPALSVTAQTRDNSTGSVSAPGTAATVAVDPVTTHPNTWTVAVPAPACAAVSPATCNVLITVVANPAAGASGTSDEVTEASLYNQTLTTYAVTPGSANVPVGSPQTYTLTASDQNGKPVAGAPVNVIATNANGSANTTVTYTYVDSTGTTVTAATTAPTSQVTDGTGTFKFTANDSNAETVTFTVRTGANPATDFSRTATLTSYVSTPTTLSFSVTPSKPVSATNGGTGTSDEYTTATPTVDVCVVDQNGNGTPAGTQPTNLLVSVTRNSTTSGVAASPSTNSTPTLTPDTATGKTNCYIVSHTESGSADFGTDTFTAYYETNNTPGVQAGEAQASVTTKFAKLVIGANNTQAQQGTNVTVPFTFKGADGTVLANRKVALTTNAGTFPTAQPAGTTYTSANSATAITDANGVVRVTLTNTGTCTPAPGTPAPGDPCTVTATDSITDPTLNQIATNVSKLVTVRFQSGSAAIKTVTATPTLLQPASNSAAGVQRPGDAKQLVLHLSDASTNSLAGVSTTLTLDHGFFTPNCFTGTNAADYNTCTFNPAPVAGAAVGNLKSLTNSLTATSDDSGDITVTVAVGRDAGFDDDGSVTAVLSATGNGGSANLAPLDFHTNNVAPINGAAVKFVAASSADRLSGDVPNTDNSTGTTGGTNFVVHLTDQFGNLVSLPNPGVALTITGGGTITTAQTTTGCPPGYGPFLPGTCFNGVNTVPTMTTTTQVPATNAKGSFTATDAANSFHVDSTTTSTTGQSNTVTGTWQAPVTTFTAPTTPGAPFTTSSTTATKTDQFTINLYRVDPANLTFTASVSPGNTVAVNSTVTDSVTVTDQKHNPVAGLNVQFNRSGPGSQSGSSTSGLRTNSAGKAGYSFSSNAPGTATVTVIVTDGSGNELSRGVQNVTFTPGTPSTTGTVTIQGPTSQFVKYGTRMVVTGKAPANSAVTVYFHRAYVAGLTPKAATANASGVWSVVYSAVDDFSYYAQVGSARAATVLTRIDPSVSGADRTARKGQMVTVSGKSGARSAVNVHVGSAVHAVRADANGVWTYTFKFAGTVAVFANRTEHDVHTAGITIRG